MGSQWDTRGGGGVRVSFRETLKISSDQKAERKGHSSQEVIWDYRCKNPQRGQGDFMGKGLGET